MTQPTPVNPKPILRLVLLLSSGAMLVFAGLILTGIVNLPTLAGWGFLAVAFADVTIAMTVFRD